MVLTFAAQPATAPFPRRQSAKIDAAEMRHLAVRKKDVLTYYLYMD